MAEQLKNMYSLDFYTNFMEVLKEKLTDLDSESFINQIFDDEWENKELKQRMRHTSIILKKHLTGNYTQQIQTILDIIPTLRQKRIGKYGFEFMFFADYVEIYGLDDYQTSIKAMEEITQFASCEFAVRPFIIKYPQKMITQIEKWSNHKSEHVRRLASEGSRPRLPWAMALPEFKKDPTPILSILENLKNDASLYVRRSVANNLNDIAKDNPDVVVSIAKNWHGENEETNWLVKHACRTLLKQGNKDVMTLFGFGSTDNIRIGGFNIITPNVSIGGVLEFSFKLLNKSDIPSKIRLEYGLYYQKANGSLSKKVFKISEKEYPKNSSTIINKKQSFKIISTRKFHLGNHKVSIIVNGNEFEKLDFELIENNL